jgi:transcriptional antiterminator RfaH
LGIEILNLKLKLKRYSNTILMENIEPLFPCYLFARFDLNKYAHLITYTRGVRYIIGKDKPIIVYDEIIDTLRKSTDDGKNVIIKPQRFQKGDKVLIQEGPFKDFSGIFEREIKGPERVMILLTTLSAASCKVLVNSYCLARA